MQSIMLTLWKQIFKEILENKFCWITFASKYKILMNSRIFFLLLLFSPIALVAQMPFKEVTVAGAARVVDLETVYAVVPGTSGNALLRISGGSDIQTDDSYTTFVGDNCASFIEVHATNWTYPTGYSTIGVGSKWIKDIKPNGSGAYILLKQPKNSYYVTEGVSYFEDEYLAQICGGGGGSGGGAVEFSHVQAGHGFSEGDLIYFMNGTTAKKAQSDVGLADSIAQWVVNDVVSADEFKYCNSCEVNVASGITPGSYLWLSTTPGDWTNVQPNTTNCQYVGVVRTAGSVYIHAGDICSPGITPLEAPDIPLNPDINFGGVITTDVQEALEAIDTRLDTAYDRGIDTVVTIGNNQYVVTQDGEQLFTGLADLKNTGRVWYVAKTGSNTGCKVGNINKPCLTLKAVKDSLVTGDAIVVFPGNYAEATITNITPTNADSITWFYMPRTFITNMYISALGTGDRYYKISGNAVFKSLPYNYFVVPTSTRKVNVSIECDEINFTGYLDFKHSFDFVEVRVKRLVFNGGTDNEAYAIGFGGENTGNDSAATGSSMASVKIDNVVISSSLTTYRLGGFVKLFDLKNKKINIDVGNFTCTTGAQALAGSVLTTVGHGLDSCLVNVNIGNVNVKTSTTTYAIKETTRNVFTIGATVNDSTFASLFFIRNVSGNHRLSLLNVSLGNVYSEVPLYSPVDGVTANFQIGNWRSNKNNPVFCTDAATTNSASITTIRCDDCNSSGSQILENGRRGINTYLGYWKTTGAGLPVIRYDAENLTTNYAFLKNCTLIAPSLTPEIVDFTGTNARSYLIQNVATNSTTANANVTPVMGAILRETTLR